MKGYSACPHTKTLESLNLQSDFVLHFLLINATFCRHLDENKVNYECHLEKREEIVQVSRCLGQLDESWQCFNEECLWYSIALNNWKPTSWSLYLYVQKCLWGKPQRRFSFRAAHQNFFCFLENVSNKTTTLLTLRITTDQAFLQCGSSWTKKKKGIHPKSSTFYLES